MMSKDLQASRIETSPEGGAPVAVPDNHASESQSHPRLMSSAPKGKAAPRMGRTSKLRLLARLHGKGFVIWPGAEVPVTYDVDVFGGAQARTASGFLDGDFAAAHCTTEEGPAGAAPMVARLRLEDESEVAIQIIVVESDLAEFEAPLTASEADLLLARR